MQPEMKNFNTDLSLEDIKNFEKEHSLKLPNDYVEFILEFNGGNPWPDTFKYEYKNTKKIEYIIIGDFNTFPYLDLPNEEYNNISKGWIGIAYDGQDYICISLNEEDYGKIYITDYFINTEKLLQLEKDLQDKNSKADILLKPLEHMLLANSFTEFINGFDKFPED